MHIFTFYLLDLRLVLHSQKEISGILILHSRQILKIITESLDQVYLSIRSIGQGNLVIVSFLPNFITTC